MAYRRFELVDGDSSKFWEIEVEGASHTVRYGRLSTKGQSRTKEFDSEEQAQASAEKLIRKKTGKGYSEAEPSAAADSVTTTPTRGADSRYPHDEPSFSPMFQAYLGRMRAGKVRKKPRAKLLGQLSDELPAALAALLHTLAVHEFRETSLCWRTLYDASVVGDPDEVEGLMDMIDLDDSVEGWFDPGRARLLGESAGGEVYFGLRWDEAGVEYFEIDAEWQSYGEEPVKVYATAEAFWTAIREDELEKCEDYEEDPPPFLEQLFKGAERITQAPRKPTRKKPAPKKPAPKKPTKKKPATKQQLRYGVIRADGSWLTEPRFEDVGVFAEGRVSVLEGGLNGFVDERGEVVIPPAYAFAYNFASGAALVQNPDGSWLSIDPRGKPLPGWRGNESEGRVRTCIDGTYSEQFWAPLAGRFGFLDTEGRVVIEPTYVMAEDFRQGLAWVQLTDGGWSGSEFAFIDPDGNTVIEPFEAGEVRVFSAEGLARFTNLEGHWCFMDRRGEVTITTGYREVSPFSEGRAVITENESRSGPYSELKGYIDLQGELVIEPRFEMAEDFSNGLAAVYLRTEISPQWGFINAEGTLVIENKFREAYSFEAASTPAAIADPRDWSANLWGLLDPQGGWVLEPCFSFMKPMVDGVARFRRPDDSWGLVDAQGNILADGYKQFHDWGGDFPLPAQLGKPKKKGSGLTGGKWGFLDARGQPLAPFELDAIVTGLSEGHAGVGKRVAVPVG